MGLFDGDYCPPSRHEMPQKGMTLSEEAAWTEEALRDIHAQEQGEITEAMASGQTSFDVPMPRQAIAGALKLIRATSEKARKLPKKSPQYLAAWVALAKWLMKYNFHQAPQVFAAFGKAAPGDIHKVASMMRNVPPLDIPSSTMPVVVLPHGEGAEEGSDGLEEARAPKQKKVSDFSPGDVVKWEAAFLKNTGQVGGAIDGLVLDTTSSRSFVMVLWSNSNLPSYVNPSNIKMKKKGPGKLTSLPVGMKKGSMEKLKTTGFAESRFLDGVRAIAEEMGFEGDRRPFEEAAPIDLSKSSFAGPHYLSDVPVGQQKAFEVALRKLQKVKWERDTAPAEQPAWKRWVKASIKVNTKRFYSLGLSFQVLVKELAKRAGYKHPEEYRVNLSPSGFGVYQTWVGNPKDAGLGDIKEEVEPLGEAGLMGYLKPPDEKKLRAALRRLKKEPWEQQKNKLWTRSVYWKHKVEDVTKAQQLFGSVLRDLAKDEGFKKGTDFQIQVGYDGEIDLTEFTRTKPK